VRPGQLLVFFERVTVAKLAVSRDDGEAWAAAGAGGPVRRLRHLLVPLSHAGQFRRASPQMPPAAINTQ